MEEAEMREFIENMPKIELHLHIEGSLEPELMFELAQRNKVDFPFSSVEEIRKAYDFNELQDFLDIYYEGMGVLQTEQDFYDLTMAYLKKIASQNVVHTEIFFDPQGHTSRGVDFDTVLSGITRALDDGKEKFGITSNLIMCFLRHLPETHTEQTLKKFPNEDDAMTTFKKLLASPFRHRVIGVGLDSSELGFPPSIFKNVFALAKKEGLKLVAHAGEEGPPEYVYEAIDILDVDRVDHGNRSLEDPKLVNKLINKNLALTVCPLSNKELCVVNDMKKHPLKKMLELGLKPTVNSDDPSYFGGYMNENFISVANALKLDKKDIVQLAKNAIDASFISADQKRQLHTQLSEYVQSYLPEAPAANSPHI